MFVSVFVGGGNICIFVGGGNICFCICRRR